MNSPSQLAKIRPLSREEIREMLHHHMVKSFGFSGVSEELTAFDVQQAMKFQDTVLKGTIKVQIDISSRVKFRTFMSTGLYFKAMNIGRTGNW